MIWNTSRITFRLLESVVLAIAVITTTSSLRAADIEIESVFLMLIDDIDVPARENGVLNTMLVKEGQSVTANELLAEIEGKEARLNLIRADLDLNIAGKQAANSLPLQLARRSAAESASKLLQSKFQLEISRKEEANDLDIQFAKKSAEVAKAEYERAKKSREAFRDSVSESELDRLRLIHEKSSLEIKQAEHDGEIAALTRAAKEAEVNALTEVVEKDKLQTQQAEFEQEISELTELVEKNDVALATEAVEKRRILAPIDGVVVQVDRRRGEWVTPGERVLRIIRLDRLRAECYVHVRHLSSGLLGAPVEFTATIDGVPQAKLAGRVVFVNPEVDPVNAQVRVWAEIENEDLVLRPGMEGTMTIRPQLANKDEKSRTP